VEQVFLDHAEDFIADAGGPIELTAAGPQAGSCRSCRRARRHN
jgi:hypothetical protein